MRWPDYSYKRKNASWYYGMCVFNKESLFATLIYIIIDSFKVYYNLDGIDFAILFSSRITGN